MTIEFTLGGNSFVGGVITYPSSTFSNLSASILNFASDVLADLNTLTVTGIPNPIWNTAGYLNLVADTTTENPSKFIGAYTRINYGVVDFSMQGLATGGYFWNYASQRFPVTLFWADFGSFMFPQPQQTTPFASDVELATLSSFSALSASRYASECAVNLISALASGVTGYYYYFAQALGVDTPYVQQSI
jgi:hypothetical protein